ncbi:putative Serine-type D-Ala-D-Ala carboxypeptidase [Candidatus Sulfobium mesophilum]|uniref:Putative Serine-type D-Ala-D-Ala carboxypeptidase n=1 Tax=Candidatus Sulfobium mesophilum TaxID=2016548 RepID=A0A2U3QJD7_9BACT|nr:putative Serine-type D-Ala-D-Ala carboxypeptidase [Candidatus Sulfobium mesophilum]
MTKKSKIQDAESFTDGKIFLCVSVFLLFIFYILLSSVVYAEEIRSRAAVVMDAVTGRVLYAKNPDLRLLPASTTKLMTALVVVERAKLSDVTTISKKAANTAPTKVGFREGDKVTLETLLYAALIKSANDAAVALAEAVAGSEEEFVALMNRKALTIGLDDTKFINANGLPGDGQHITAYDLSKIMRQAIKYPVLKEILGTRMTEVATETGRTKFIKNTNKLLWSDEELLGGKTGFTRQARHCFVCAGEREHETIIVALLGAPSRDLLWKESEQLMDFGLKVINRSEEPVVYLSKDDRNGPKATTALYTERSGPADEGKKLKGKKTRHGRSSKHKYVTAQHKSKNKRMVKVAQKSKNKKVKKTNIAEMDQDGVKG